MEATQISAIWKRWCDLVWHKESCCLACLIWKLDETYLKCCSRQPNQSNGTALLCFVGKNLCCVARQLGGCFFYFHWSEIFRNYGKKTFEYRITNTKTGIIRTHRKVAWELWSMSLRVSHSTSWVWRLELNIYPNVQSSQIFDILINILSESAEETT